MGNVLILLDRSVLGGAIVALFHFDWGHNDAIIRILPLFFIKVVIEVAWFLTHLECFVVASSDIANIILIGFFVFLCFIMNISGTVLDLKLINPGHLFILLIGLFEVLFACRGWFFLSVFDKILFRVFFDLIF